MTPIKAPTELFRDAKKFCLEHGFEDEIEQCEHREPFCTVTKSRFLAQYAYVIFNSGMKNSVIEAKWKEICKAFLWFNADEIKSYQAAVREKALSVFGNKAKVNAIIKMANHIELTPTFFNALKERIQKNPLDELEKFPFIAKVTKYHLARNLGFDYVKPDRHLVRLAEKYGMTPFELCKIIQKETGEKLGVIDVILWRYCEQQGQTQLRKKAIGS